MDSTCKRVRCTPQTEMPSGTETVVVGQYDARGVPGLADQHAAIRGYPGDQLGLGRLILGRNVRGCFLGAVALHDRQAAAPEAGAAEPGAEDARGLQEDLVQLYHLFAPCRDFRETIASPSHTIQ